MADERKFTSLQEAYLFRDVGELIGSWGFGKVIEHLAMHAADHAASSKKDDDEFGVTRYTELESSLKKLDYDGML